MAKKVLNLAARIPARDLAEDGRETEPHITVLFGLHTPDPATVRALLRDEPPITVTLGKTSFFPNGESGSGDVLKVDVRSPSLRRLNKRIAEAIAHTNTHPDYQPHCTIAYVKPGRGKAYAGGKALDGQIVRFHALMFSSKDGSMTTIPLGGQKN